MFMQTEATPNPAALKLLPGQPVMGRDTAEFATREDATRSLPACLPYEGRQRYCHEVMAMDLKTYNHINRCGCQHLQLTSALKSGGRATLCEVVPMRISKVSKQLDLRPEFTSALPALLPPIPTQA